MAALVAPMAQARQAWEARMVSWRNRSPLLAVYRLLAWLDWLCTASG